MNHQDIGGLLLTGSIEGHETLALFVLGSSDFYQGIDVQAAQKFFGRVTRIVCIEDKTAGINIGCNDVDDSIRGRVLLLFPNPHHAT